MALKLNIQPDVDQEMESLLKKTTFRSKTEYINQAIFEFNKHIKRRLQIENLKIYFNEYQDEGQKITEEFSKFSPFSN